MFLKRSSIVLAAICSLAFATGALALNPQPEPPFPYHGYEVVITRVDQFRWRWEIIHPAQGNSGRTTVDSGYVRGTHGNAEQKARVRIDRLVIQTGPTGTYNSPAVKSQVVPKLSMGLICDNRVGADPATGKLSAILRLTATGPGLIPAGTHIVWTIYGHPPMQGDYVFESAIWPKSWVDVAYQPPQHGYDYAHSTCFVNLKP